MKTILTFLFAVIGLTVEAQSINFSEAGHATGGNNPLITSLYYSSQADGVVGTGEVENLSVTPPNGLTNSLHNVFVVHRNGSVTTLGTGAPTKTMYSCEAAGTLFVATTTGLLSYDKVNNVLQSENFSTNGTIFATIPIDDKTNILALGNFTDANGMPCSGAIRYNPTTKTVDTCGLDMGLPLPLQGMDDQRIKWVHFGDATYFTWFDTYFEGYGFMKYENGRLWKVADMPGSPQFTLTSVVEVDTTTNTLFVQGLTTNTTEKMFKFNNGLWETVFTFTDNGAASEMKLYNNNLYISGNFSAIDYQPTSNNIVVYPNGQRSSFSTPSTTPLGHLAFFPTGEAVGACGLVLFTTITTTGITDPATLTTALFPNPANDFITVTTSERTPIVITNSLGQKLIETQAEKGNNTINISTLPSGTFNLNGKTLSIQH